MVLHVESLGYTMQTTMMNIDECTLEMGVFYQTFPGLLAFRLFALVHSQTVTHQNFIHMQCSSIWLLSWCFITTSYYYVPLFHRITH